MPKNYLRGDVQEAQQFLHWAAQLHELGHDIAHNQYHKHSAYVIENGDFAGFSRQDQMVLARIVRAHRRKFPAKIFADLPTPWNHDAQKLAVLLRLAVLLHRSRQDYDVPKFKLSLSKFGMKLQFPKGWLDSSPLTHADLLHEASHLKAVGLQLSIK